MSDPLLACREITKAYRNNAVLRALSISLAPGAVVGLLGKNGSGKTTLIKCALGHEPDLLVLDEPAAALDPLARRAFLSALLDIAADAGRTVLFSTHITADLERVASHVAILKDGAIAWFGPLDALKDRVKRLLITAPHPFSKTFTFAGALAQQIAGNQARISILDATPDHLESLRHELGAQIDVEDLNLDDIFLEFHHA